MESTDYLYQSYTTLSQKCCILIWRSYTRSISSRGLSYIAFGGITCDTDVDEVVHVSCLNVLNIRLSSIQVIQTNEIAIANIVRIGIVLYIEQNLTLTHHDNKNQQSSKMPQKQWKNLKYIFEFSRQNLKLLLFMNQIVDLVCHWLLRFYLWTKSYFNTSWQ